MRVRFRTRIVILLCGVVFGVWLFWPNSVTWDCNSGGKSCSNRAGVLLHNVAKPHEKNTIAEFMVGIVKDKRDLDARDEGYSKHAFNDLISRRIGYQRTIPDTRHEMCKDITYSQNLPTASVIICFHNEAWSTLLRTVHTVLDRTPHYLLHEIILMDDFSSEGDLKQRLDSYFENYSRVSIVRATKREGLIRGRALGASKATGNVLVFLDSHCEVNINWLPPLLEPISRNQKTVVCPIIDIINSHTFQYTASPLVKGGFNWGLHFQWEPIDFSTFTTQDFTKPIRSPTMAGGLFAIDTKYFNLLGRYDNGMNIWGGENLEISFRIWMCGGELKIIPCSRVGHVFRNRRPYGEEGMGDTMSYNSLRVAEVWMDEYKKHFYDVRSNLKGKSYGDVSARRELRRTLKCKSFQWFLYNVYTELDIPSERKGSSLIWRPPIRKKKTIVENGKLGNSRDYCLAVESEAVGKDASLTLRRCDEVSLKSSWSLNDAYEMKLRAKLCLDVRKTTFPILRKCHEDGGTQQWIFVKTSEVVYHPASGTCLSHSPEHNAVMAICNESDSSQKWTFVNH